MSDEKITIGEVYRLCVEIKAAVKEQNGRVRKLEDDSVRIKTIWAAGAVIVAMGLDWMRRKLGF
jgi:hypothetical protein